MTLIHIPPSSGKKSDSRLGRQGRGGQLSAALPADTGVRLKAGKNPYRSSAVPRLTDLVSEMESRCQQKELVVVAAVEVRAAIERARCLPCDVGHMLLV